MDIKPRGYDRVFELMDKGVDIPNPLSLDIGEDVDTDRISGNGVTLFPGCRIYGRDTTIASGVRIGAEGPVTIDDCRLGPGVELKGGYFRRSVFLEGARMGWGAHVREGCLLEEETSGAHCVGLKQTILFPFVTLGSLINFCDCLMAGGTSRQDHSEVGSSYIHFNYTPDGDKTTPSLIGDVPRGVMLNQPPIFLGGQGGMVGPLVLGFGNTVAAGTLLRRDVVKENLLVMEKPPRGGTVHFARRTYPGLSRIVKNNILYLANLKALEQWYLHVRRPFFEEQEFGPRILEGALAALKSAVEERLKRLDMLGQHVADTLDRDAAVSRKQAEKREFCQKAKGVSPLFREQISEDLGAADRGHFLEAMDKAGGGDIGYLQALQALPAPDLDYGTRWLQAVVEDLCGKAAGMFEVLRL